MNYIAGFIEWVQEFFSGNRNFSPIDPGIIPSAAYFDLSYKSTSSLMKGYQWYFFKILPPELNEAIASQLVYERRQTVRARSSFFKVLQDFLSFIYVSPIPIDAQVLHFLANFYSARKSIFSNVTELNFFLDISEGRYTTPQKIGIYGYFPIKRFIKEVERFFLSPYCQWVHDRNV